MIKNVVNYSIRFPVYLNARKAMVAWKEQRFNEADVADQQLQQQRHLAQDKHAPALNFAESWLCGAVAGAASCLFSHPSDVVKAQMMSLDAHKFRGSNLACLQSVWRDGGLRGLYTGELCFVFCLFFLLFLAADFFTKLFSGTVGWCCTGFCVDQRATDYFAVPSRIYTACHTSVH